MNSTSMSHPQIFCICYKLESLPSHAGQLRKDLFPRDLVNGRELFSTLTEREGERRKNKNPRVTLTALNYNESKNGVI